MKAAHFTSSWRKRRQAMALIMVVTMVALMSILMVAIFSITRTEYKSTQVYVAGKNAKQLGDIATAIVQGQIENAQNPDRNNTSVSSQMYTHATQPGMVRTYDSTGGFYAAYKLYSSSAMKVGGAESSLYTDQHVPPSTWNTQTARYVDLNDPVVRAGLNAGSYAVYFPIIDPRAAWNYGNGGQGVGTQPGGTQVEGFSYTKTAAQVGSGGGQNYSTVVVTPSDTDNPDSLRLPMPVEWLYVLEDGTVGALTAANTFVGSNGTPASADNPIVGRIAFWTDDESCKININTASEPTFMSSPFYFHERDVKWAHFPAVTGEYQRYPGHPATVALSAVLAPNYTLDPMKPDWDSAGGIGSYSDVVNLKEQIYALMPKISGGGSKEGTLPFAVDQLTTDQTFGSTSQPATAIDLTTVSKERLFASVDELLFKDLLFNTSTGGRSQASITLPNGNTIFDHNTLERSRFFLTSQSRSPEFSIHGLPRVCIWPIADESMGNKKRTTFDNMTAFCSTLLKGASNGSYSYSFRRAYAKDYVAQQSGASPDVDITRNKTLLNYLVNQMTQLSWPQTSYQPNSTGSQNFSGKYGSNNVNQLAVQFFDYIRCTNLYDGIESRNNNATSVIGQSVALQADYADKNYNSVYTFTNPRLSQPPTSITVSGDASSNTAASTTGTLAGHGQVSPSIWNTGGTQYKGLGRMFTISEIGFQFICTGDGASHLVDNNGLNTGTNNPSLKTVFTTAAPNKAVPQYDGDGGGAAIAYGTQAVTGTPQTLVDKVANLYGASMTLPPGGPFYWSNFPPLSAAPTKDQIDFYMALYGCQATTGRTSSDPRLHPAKHPGFYPQNWNMTLIKDTPLKPTERRIQVILMLEFFCPSVGWTGFNPEWTVVLDKNIGNMQVAGQRLFNTTDGVEIKSNGNVYDNSAGAHAVGGHAGPSAIAGGRLSRTISGGNTGANTISSQPVTVEMPSDESYNAQLTPTYYGNGNTSGHNALQNYAFCSDFITVPNTSDLSVSYPGVISVSIYDTHNYQTAKPVQIIDVDLSKLPATVPVPRLAGSTPYTETIDQYGRITYHRTRLGPHYWAANFSGCVNRLQGTPNPNFNTTNQANGQYTTPLWSVPPKPQVLSYDNHSQALHGRLDSGAGLYVDQRGQSTSLFPQTVNLIADGISDVVCTLVPAAGDYRTLAAKYHVPSDWWQPHPFTKFLGSNGNFKVHSFTSYQAGAEAGCMLATASPTATANDPQYQLVADAGMNLPAINGGQQRTTLNPMQADLPPDQKDYVYPANAYGDFDTGIASEREGPYINKPDEGNYYVGKESTGGNQTYRSAYFYNDWNNADDWRSGIFMTPNRMIASPVMFGSLPTGVWGSNNLPNAAQNSTWGGLSSTSAIAPWQTLLFRPHIYNTQSSIPSQQYHPGMENPCDHYLLDLFFMPVVEPYAISEPLSIAGRINMNYQIMPFTNIRRATGMHAVMKGEFMTAVPNNQIVYAKEYKVDGSGNPVWKQNFFNDKNDGFYWHRPVDPAATLRQFDLKFAHQSGGSAKYQGLFRSASQICEMHLIPRTVNNGTFVSNVTGVTTASNQDQINQSMNTFWSNNRPTGDNVRERPYSNLYARLTTRSNTFRVHVRAQVLKKARSTDPTIVDPLKDAVISEYRGSTLLERYIDPSDATLGVPDYAAGSITQAPLDSFYRFHVLETKRFNP